MKATTRIAPRGLRAPLRRNQYQEGGSLAYLIRMAGHEVLVTGSMNYLEREMEALRPDIALVGANSQRLEIHDFTGRLMRALGYPALADRQRFLEEVAAASPTSRTLVPTWFEPIVVPARATAATRAAARRRVDPPGLAPLVPAYSVAIRDGDFVFVSGMTGVKPGDGRRLDAAAVCRPMAYRGSFTASFIRNGTPSVIHLGAGAPRKW